MDTCDIDNLRDLVRRQHHAKNSWLQGNRQPLAEVDVERQVNTYLAQGTTVAALTKCVETTEKEATERIETERAALKEQNRKHRILRVCDAAKSYDEGEKKNKLDFLSSRHYDLTRDIQETIKEIGDPYA